MTRDELQKIMDQPGFGTGRAYRDQKAQENDAIALLPDRAWMKAVMASPDAGAGWLVCSFGNSGNDAQDWHLVTDNVRASGMADAMFPEDARTDAHAIAAVLNAWRMGLIVLRPDLAHPITLPPNGGYEEARAQCLATAASLKRLGKKRKAPQ